MSITLSNVLRLLKPGVYMHWCPGCNTRHAFNTSAEDNPNGAKWSYNGDLVKPTFAPSMHIKVGPYVDTENPADNEPQTVCHYHLTAGMLQYLGDCTHALAGQTVPLPEWPGGRR